MWTPYRNYRLQIALGLLLALLLISATYWPIAGISDFLTRIERQYYDFNLSTSSTQTPDTSPPIVLIDIDENSISQMGGWPRPRSEIANFLEKIAQSKPHLIAFTHTFAFPDENPIDELDNKLKEAQQKIPKDIADLRDSLDEDNTLTQTLKKHGIILSYLFHDQRAQVGLVDLAKSKPLPDPELNTGQPTTGYMANLKSYQSASKDEGFIASRVDTDGILRSAPLVMQLDNTLYPALPLVIAKQYQHLTDYNILLSERQGKKVYQGIRLGASTIPTDPIGRILIPYQVDLATITRIPAIDIYNNEIISELKDAIVIIGSSANSLGNLKPTPIKAAMAEFEIQALTLYGLLHPECLWYQPAWWYQVIMAELIIAAIIMLVLFPLCRPIYLLVLATTLIGTVIFFHYLLHELWQAYIAPTAPLLFIIFTFLSFLVAALFFENKSRTELQHRFGQYVPPDHIKRMLDDPQAVNLEGERREMTVLFADLHDFTQISENLSTQNLKQFLNRYLTHATKTIFDQRGTIDKYIGDMIMAFWGAPLPQNNHAEQSVCAALALQKMLQHYQNEFSAFGIPEVKLGIGINTGEMNVGEMGSDYRRAYTVLGDSVNVAARIEPLTRFYEVGILVSEATKNQCPHIFFRSIDKVRVKGKQSHLVLYEPIALLAELSETQKKLYEAYELGLAHCYAQRWQEALAVLEPILEHLPNDAVTKLYIKRVKDCMCTPIPYWTGVQDHLQKG